MQTLCGNLINIRIKKYCSSLIRIIRNPLKRHAKQVSSSTYILKMHALDWDMTPFPVCSNEWINNLMLLQLESNSPHDLLQADQCDHFPHDFLIVILLALYFTCSNMNFCVSIWFNVSLSAFDLKFSSLPSILLPIFGSFSIKVSFEVTIVNSSGCFLLFSLTALCFDAFFFMSSSSASTTISLALFVIVSYANLFIASAPVVNSNNSFLSDDDCCCSFLLIVLLFISKLLELLLDSLMRGMNVTSFDVSAAACSLFLNFISFLKYLIFWYGSFVSTNPTTFRSWFLWLSHSLCFYWKCQKIIKKIGKISQENSLEFYRACFPRSWHRHLRVQTEELNKAWKKDVNDNWIIVNCSVVYSMKLIFH